MPYRSKREPETKFPELLTMVKLEIAVVLPYKLAPAPLTPEDVEFISTALELEIIFLIEAV